MKQRSITADVLKGLAVIFMIQVHIMEVFADTSIYHSLTGRISLFLGGPPAAPVFMAVMGYFLAASSKGMMATVTRGFKLILGGLALNVAINLNLLYRIISGTSDANPLSFVFGIDILVLAGFTVIVTGLLKKVFDLNFLIPLAVGMMILAVTPMVNDALPATGGTSAYLLSMFGGEASWSYFPLFPWMAYPLFGYSAYLFIKAGYAGFLDNKSISNLLLIAWAVFIALTINFGIDTAAKLKDYYHHGIIYGLWAIAFTAGYALLISRLSQHAPESPFLEYFAVIGKNVTLAYVVQWVIIGNTGTSVFRSLDLSQAYVAMIAIILITSMVVYLNERGYFLKMLKYRARNTA